jgi:hypothetical protein
VKYTLNQKEICEALKDYIADRGVKFERTKVRVMVDYDERDNLVIHAEVSEVL